MYYSYVEIEYVATSFSPARTDLALKLLRTHKQMLYWSIFMVSLGTCCARPNLIWLLMKASDIDVFLSDAAWAVRSTYHTVLNASPGAAIFGGDMLFDILFIADWHMIGEHRQ